VVGGDVGRPCGDRHGLGQPLLLPTGGRLVAERDLGELLAVGRPQVPGVRARVVGLLVEAQRGDEAVLARAELHPDLDRRVGQRVAERALGRGEHRARARCWCAEAPGPVRLEAVAGAVGDAVRAAHDRGRVGAPHRQRCGRRERRAAGGRVVGDRGAHRGPRIVLEREGLPGDGGRVYRLVERDGRLRDLGHVGRVVGKGDRGDARGAGVGRRAGREDRVDPVVRRVPAVARVPAARAVAVDAVAAVDPAGRSLQRRAADRVGAVEVAGAEGEAPLGRVVGDDIGGVLGDGHRLLQRLLLPARGGLVRERHFVELLPRAAPEVPGMRARVVGLLVEAQRSDVAVLGRADLHADLDRAVAERVSARAVGRVEDRLRMRGGWQTQQREKRCEQEESRRSHSPHWVSAYAPKV